MARKKSAVSAPAAPKTGKEKKPSLAGIMNLVAGTADTQGTKINVSETKRCIRQFVDTVVTHYPDPLQRLQFLIKTFS